MPVGQFHGKRILTAIIGLLVLIAFAGRMQLVMAQQLTGTPAQPAAEATATPTNAVAGNELDDKGALYHIVQPGESLYYIAESNGMDTYTILSLNGLPADVILQPGDRLLLRLPEPPTALPTFTSIPMSELAKTPSITPSPTMTVQPLGEQIVERITVKTMTIVVVLVLVVAAGFALAVWAGRKKL